MASPASDTATPTAKQLVFLFMAATVVAVVVFLCGVLVGRGVPLRQGRDGSDVRTAGAAAAFGEHDLRPADSVSVEPSVAASAADDLTYYRRLGSDRPVDETLLSAPTDSPVHGVELAEPVLDSVRRPISSPAAPPAVSSVPTEVEANTPAPVAFDAQTAGGGESITPAMPMGDGYTVQVAALRAHDAAEQIAGRLIAKGYPAYVLDPAPDAPVAVFRVRVGRYSEHSEAERIRQRLEREEQFKPWITR